MWVRGKVFKQRRYIDSKYSRIKSILFITMEEAISVNGEKIKVIPILTEDPYNHHEIGENIDVDGEIEYLNILTPLGQRSIHPIPVLRPYRNRKYKSSMKVIV